MDLKEDTSVIWVWISSFVFTDESIDQGCLPLVWHDWQSVFISWQFTNMGDGLDIRIKFDGIERKVNVGDGVDEVLVGVVFKISGISLDFHMTTLVKKVWLTIAWLATAFVMLAIVKRHEPTGATSIDRACWSWLAKTNGWPLIRERLSGREWPLVPDWKRSLTSLTIVVKLELSLLLTIL